MGTRTPSKRAVLLAAIVQLVCTPPAPANWTTLVSNGHPTKRVDLVFLGDGYTQADLDAGIYRSHVEGFVDYMFGAPEFLADPFPRYHKFFNVHAVDVVSNESGADNPDPSGIVRDTALDATYDVMGFPQLLTIDQGKASSALVSGLAGSGIIAEIRLVSVNDDEYGGSGGLYAVFAGANEQAHDIALHELSHAFSNTADEYGSLPYAYVGAEPGSVNATKDPAAAKWSHWLGFEDPRADFLRVDVFEGALSYAQGIYRPTLDSKMRTLGRPFNAVVRERTILDIYAIVDPVDNWLDNGATIAGSQLWLEVVDPGVISVDWYVDGDLVALDHGEAFDLSDFRCRAGSYTIRAHAYDRAVRHAGDGSLLDLVRTNLAALQQEIVWTVDFPGPPIPGDYNGDRVVDAADYLVWKSDFGSSEKLAADGSRNGIVDAADYVIWRNQLTIQSMGGVAGHLAAPEPTSGALLLMLLAVLFVRRRI